MNAFVRVLTAWTDELGAGDVASLSKGHGRWSNPKQLQFSPKSCHEMKGWKYGIKKVFRLWCLNATPEYTVAIRRPFAELIPIEGRDQRYHGYVSPTNVEVIDIKRPDILIIY